MEKYKYPRTYHLPFSNTSNDDKKHPSVDFLLGKEVIVTEKMDGENSSFSQEYYHARSLDSNNHPSRDYVKHFWSSIQYFIPEGIRICGENLYAQHSIRYENLPDFFLAFSAWKDDTCLSWDETLRLFKTLSIFPVRTLYEGVYDIEKIHAKWKTLSEGKEGYVIRLRNSFTYDNFSESVVKFVRPNHVQTGDHWMNSTIIKNKMNPDYTKWYRDLRIN